MYTLHMYESEGAPLFTSLALNATNDAEAQAEARGWCMGLEWVVTVHRLGQAEPIGSWKEVNGELAWDSKSSV